MHLKLDHRNWVNGQGLYLDGGKKAGSALQSISLHAR